MFIMYSIHYPKPGDEARLVENMHQVDELMGRQPGTVFVPPYPFKDPAKGTLLGLSIWESEEALRAALPTIQQAWREAPAQQWERRPPELYMLHSADE